MKIPFDIFIGGPMGNDASDDAGASFKSHLPNMKTALERIRDEISESDLTTNIRIHTPELDEAGMITSRVFGMIDGAELAIMDVSSGSPNVMYELAMLHALGTPTIPVILGLPDGKPAKTPFYLKDSYSAVVENFSAETLYQKLAPMVRTVIGGGGGSGANPAMNPMTAFYDIALVDASATTGLATGYFHNFIQHVIPQVGGVFKQLDYEVKKFVIIKPENLSETSDLLNRVQNVLEKEGIEVQEVIYQVPTQVRHKILLFRAKHLLFCVPAPLNVQLSSPRYKRVKRDAELNAKGPRRAETAARLARHEAQLLEKFFSILRYLARTYQNVNPDLMQFMTIDEFVDAVKGR